MTLRAKLIAALVGMVIFMALIFAQISQFSLESYSKHAEAYVEYGFAQQWERILKSYYIDRGSWKDLDKRVAQIYDETGSRPNRLAPQREMEKLIVFNENKKAISSAQKENIGKSLSDFFDEDQLNKQYFQIEVNGKTVGYFGLKNVSFDFGGRIPGNVGKGLTDSLTQATLTALVITALLALLFGIFFTRHLTGPLRELTKGVKKVGAGDYSFRLKVKGRDDIALLSQAFNGMMEQIAQNEEVRRNMVADVAHELRTPLAIISGKLESIQQGVVSSDPENLLPIQDETIRLIRLVRDLQQLSLAEAGKLPLAWQNVNLKQLIEKILEQFEVEFKEKNIFTVLQGEVQEIAADPDRLTQVFVNLIGNALRHTGEGGTVTISFNYVDKIKDNEAKKLEAREDKKGFWAVLGNKNKEEGVLPRWLRIKVADTGEGIPEDELKHIFDRFYRLDQARNRESGGSGLGLAIAKEFIQAHGGWIEVESTLGVGTIFSIYLNDILV